MKRLFMNNLRQNIFSQSLIEKTIKLIIFICYEILNRIYELKV